MTTRTIPDTPPTVIPAQAGIHPVGVAWIPACTGMTAKAKPVAARWLAALAALLLTTTPALAQKPLPNPFSDKLATLKDIPRRAVLRRAVLDNNRWCDRVIDDRRQGTWRNLSMWTVRCGRGAEYGVFIGPDQSVQVNPCADMAKSKLPACQLPPRRK